MRIDRNWIERHIPHQGRMCLWDEVLEWSDGQIRCRGATHRAADHPLRAHGRLGIACGVEYAAQAMAVHGALTAGEAARAPDSGKPPPGFLVSVRGLRMHASRLDDVAGDLVCTAARTAADGGTALYEFELRCAAACLLEGRATVVFDAAGRIGP